LAILLLVYRHFKTANLDEISKMKGWCDIRLYSSEIDFSIARGVANPSLWKNRLFFNKTN
jgi:hypothetical protein